MGEEGCYLVVSGSFPQEDITMYAPDSRWSKYVRQKLIDLKSEIDRPLLEMETSASPCQKLTGQASRKSVRMELP